MSRPVLGAAIGGLILGLILAAVAFALWLPGPRAALPSAPAAAMSDSPNASPVPTHSRIGLPNSSLTPGSINPDVTQDNLATTICRSGWASTVRPPNAYTSALKLAQIIEYGYADRSPSHYQEDHLVPLEIGGAPRDPRNLWPEPNATQLPDGTTVEAAQKDALEDYLHSAVCRGGLPLADAQRLIAGDWIAAWIGAGRP